MPGLDPGIHAPPLGTLFGTIGAWPHRVDPRIKSGDDEEREANHLRSQRKYVYSLAWGRESRATSRTFVAILDSRFRGNDWLGYPWLDSV